MTNRNLHKNIILLILSVIVACMIILASGCSDARNPSSLPDIHPDSWMDINSSDFHGFIALASCDSITGECAQLCQDCHGVNYDGGKVEVSCIECHAEQAVCTSCHGGTDNNSGAPPRGLEGEISDTSLAVGAHTIHLKGGTLGRAVECSICHIVPAFTLDRGHRDGSDDFIAELTFGLPLDTLQASWNHDSATCQNIYCHGNFSGGDSSNHPIWNQTNQAECGSCHDIGSSPENLGWKHEAHVAWFGLNCADCHANVVDSSLNIIEPNLHINFAVDTSIADPILCANCHDNGSTNSCTTCHGGTDNLSGAPPVGLRNETERTDLAVGAHSAHVDGDGLSDGVPCAECHLVPQSFIDPGHFDIDSIAEITFGSLAGSNPTWDRATATCQNTYCHGDFAGGKNSSPLWNTPDVVDMCGSCHDFGAHSGTLSERHLLHVSYFGLGCFECHSSVVDSLGTITGLSEHVNGVVDQLVHNEQTCDRCHTPTPESCTDCHGGTDNLTGAPPLGLHGETSANTLAVGAHRIHLEGSFLSNGFACNECHLVPNSVADPGHIDTGYVAEMNFGTLAGGASSWDRNNATCSNIYCHGNFNGGDSNNDVLWNAPDQARCGSCHDVGISPQDLGGEHQKHITGKGYGCNTCHATTADTQDPPNILNRDLHITGTAEISFSSGLGTYSNGSCSDVGCHGTKDW